jgi:hypothetical protein
MCAMNRGQRGEVAGAVGEGLARQAGSAKSVVEKALPAGNLLLLDKILNKALLLSSGD